MKENDKQRIHKQVSFTVTAMVVTIIGLLLNDAAFAAQTDNETCNCKVGMKYKLKGDYANAVKCWRDCAERGHMVAQVELGNCYARGKGVDCNWQQAAKWYLKAGEQGQMHATYMVAICYLSGDGVAENNSEGVKWLQKSANQGTPDAQYLLGLCYVQGCGVRTDYEKAIYWFRKAAEYHKSRELSVLSSFLDLDNDDDLVGEAQFTLGKCYEIGRGVKKNLEEARKWYEKAAKNKVKEAEDALAQLNAVSRQKVSPDSDRKYKSRATIMLPGGAIIEMIYCPPGEFLMGSDEYGPVHRVKITKGFWLSKYEVTQKQWESVMGENPSSFSGDKSLPVESIFWSQANAFCEKVNSARYCGARLPTEAEWEYACRAGTRTDFNIGKDIVEGDANCRMEFKWPIEPRTTQPVGRFKPNRWGFYDMHGNVMEWCSDEWDYNYYKASPLENPQGPNKGSRDHVLRGGSFDCEKSECSSAYRSINGTMGKMPSNFGMRLCCDKIP